MALVLVLCGGSPHAHDFAASGRALRDVVTGDGHDVEVVDHPDLAADRLAGGRYDALAVNGLWWRMLGEKYDEWRHVWGYHTPERTRAAIDGFVVAGGGLVALHTASICFDDWPGWRDVLGGAWSWERSSHPPPSPARAVITGDGHPVVAGLPRAIDVVDEVYGDLDVRDDVAVLVRARRGDGDEPQPVVWAYEHGDGRVVYDAFGHDGGSLRMPAHEQLVRQAVEWVVEPR